VGDIARLTLLRNQRREQVRVERIMSSSFDLWERLPGGLLKKGYRGWSQVDYEVRLLIVALAEQQKFKCALCNCAKELEIEHDSDPEYGEGDRYTIYNIRGLACRRCNWRIMMFEKEARGECTGWQNSYTGLTDHQYWDYIYSYERRTNPLIEAALEDKLGSVNYWRRRNMLWKFDEWNDGWQDYPWHWGFEEIKEKRHGKIRTPRQAMYALRACMQFVVDEKQRIPDWEPPSAFVDLMVRLKPLLDSLRPIYEARAKSVSTVG
jgi:DNA-directed RNA polymerase subunit RPC12/RpoP